MVIKAILKRKHVVSDKWRHVEPTELISAIKSDPWTFPLNIRLNMLPLDFFMSCLDSLLEYSTGEFQALQLIVLAEFVLLFRNQLSNVDSGFVSLTWWRTTCSLFLTTFYIYPNVSPYYDTLFSVTLLLCLKWWFLYSVLVLSLYIFVVLTLSI